MEDRFTVGLVYDKNALFELIKQLLVADTGYLRLNIEVPSQRYEAVDECDVDKHVPDAFKKVLHRLWSLYLSIAV